MDLPPYHHHHHRYVQRPPNFFHQLPPPPHPPPPPPPPIPNLPLPPPPYHHVSHQFSFTTHRAPLENPQFFDYRRSPPRVSSNLTLDPPPYHHPYPPNIPYHDHYRTASPPPSPHPRLVIDDFIENRACAVNDNKERVWIRRDVEFNVDDDDERYHLARRRMDVRSCAGNYESDNDNYQGQRWDYGNVDDVLVEHRRVAALDNGYDDYSDVRFSSRLREEIHRSPPQKQKKSALLRIQCAKANNNNRGRNQENDSRGKQKDVCERLDRMVEGRQGSPMDLDVSFKSNALVAKAVMTPPRPSVDPERSGTPRPKKIRKVNLSASPMKKNGDDLGKGESSANDSGHRLSSSKEYKCLVTGSAGGSSSNSTLNSNKESKRLSDKITDSAGGRASDGTLNSDKESELLPDKMTVHIVRSAIVRSEGVRSAVVRSEVVRSVCNNTPLLSSHGMNDLFGTGESKGSPEVVVLDQGSSQVGKDGTPLRKFRKKKKNAKKKKKVTTPIRVGVDPGNAIDAQKKVTLFCQQDEDVVDLVEKTTSDQVTIVEDANMTMPSDELVSEIEKPSEMTVVGEDESIKQSNSDGKEASSASVLVSSSNLDSGINDVADCTSRSLPSSPSMLNSTFMIGVQNTRTGFAPDNVGGHSQDELRVSEDGLAKESSDTMVCVEGNDDVVLSSHDGSTIPTSLAADNAGGHSQDELRVSGDGLIKESSEAMIFVEGNSSVVLSSLDGSDIPTSFGADNVGGHSQDELRVSEDGIKVPSEVERNSDIVLSSLDGSKIPTSFCADNVAGHSQDEFRVTEDGLNKEPSEAMVCVEGNGDVVLSSEGGSKILESEVSSTATDTYISSVSDLEFSDGKKNAVAIIGSLEAGSMETSSHPKIVPVPAYIEKGLQESFLDGNDSFNSHEAGRIAVVDDSLSAECLSNSGPGAGTFVGSMDRSCVDWVTVSPEMSQTKGSGKEMVSVVDDITINVDDGCLSKFTSERKYSDAQSALTTTRTSHTKGNACSSLLVQGNCLREEQSSREEEVTVAGEGNDSPKGDHSHGDCLKDIPSSCCAKSPKKRNVSSPRLVNTVSCVTTHEGPSNMPVTVPLTNNAYVTELESQNTFSNAYTGPPSHPSVILLESNTAKDGCQAAPIEDDSMDHFSDIQQIIACSQLGAAGKETTNSGVSVGSLGMAYAVSEEKGSSLGIDQKMAQEDRKCHNHVLEKEDIPLLANNLSLFADSNGVPAMKASGKGVEMVPNVSPPAAISLDLPINSTSVELTHSSTSNEIVIKDPNVAENSVTANDPVSCSVKISSDTSEFGGSPDHEVGGIPLVNVNTVSLSSQFTVKSTQNVSSLSWKPNFYANQQSPAGPRGFSGRPSPSFIAPRNVPISKKPLTWCRTGNSSSSDLGRGSQKNFLPPQSHLPKVTGKVSSYFRKGNSLVRNPSPVGSLFQAYHAPSSSVYRLNSSGVNDLKRKSENRTDVTDSPSCKRTLEVNAPSIAFSCSSERPKTPPQSEPFCCITTKSTSLPVVDHPGNGSIATNSDILEVTEKTLKPSEHASTSSALPECGLRGNSESQNTVDEGSSGKKIVYVKQKSNQLVAASDKSQTSSHGYYKRRKNQLIRASSTNHMKQRVGAAENIVPIRSGMKRLSGLARTSKWSKSPLVWKLGDAQSSRKYGSTVGYEKLWPCLFPWKRASYRRSFLSSSPNDSSTSIIRRKLLLAKKRETIYTRSIYGLSLRRSKVLSVSGSSLKWSKSIEQRSKKAIEEAARPVAAVAKRKRAQDGSNADLVNENNVSRERIFRIGCERYKMDPSGKTLQRISDEEPSVSVVPEVKKSYIPKRLLIGNDEYVRVGNGNKLVRNPKRRVRLLANEKVRWSLHTARIRLAKKKQYCQFFTRFGKCNKDNGKCPYIHDPSKIAVCTKFLNGSCSDSNCKLTHEVIPERMQDCSYFLQGICSNENCPYRHVNVNPNASVCEGFLRGYCADGNECRKKHTYVCPVFEATGSCSQGSKCKLHHPKNRRKGVKRKASSELKNVRGRYFGSPRIDISERITAGSEKPSVNGSADIFFKEGKFVDFISLDDEEGQTIDQRSEETPICESGSAEMRLDDLDELIKPVCLLNRNRSVNSSPFIGSPSDMTASYVSEESLL